MKKLITVLLTVMLLIANTAYADKFNDATKAYNSGKYKQAIKLFKPLALKGNANAQFNLGIMYDKGEGVVQDYVEALKWYKLAAAQGHTNAQNNLGFMYRNGQGVVQDYVEAMKWFNLAAVQGFSLAQHNLGIMYKDGQGVAQDYVEAIKWFKLAAAQGFTNSQTILGFMYGNGEGVTKDYVSAHMWFNLAAVTGDKDAVNNRDLFSKLMTQQEIAEAQKLARECLARKYKVCQTNSTAARFISVVTSI